MRSFNQRTLTYTAFPLVVTAFLAALQEASFASRNDVTFPLELLIAVGTAVGLLAAFVTACLGKAWRRAASVLVGVLLAYGIIQLCIANGLTSTWVRWQIVQTKYEREVSDCIARAEPCLTAFPWGESGGAAATNVFGTLVFDESDEITKPADQRSAEWRAQTEVQAGRPMYSIANPNPALRRNISIRRLGGHFYVVTEIY